MSTQLTLTREAIFVPIFHLINGIKWKIYVLFIESKNLVLLVFITKS